MSMRGQYSDHDEVTPQRRSEMVSVADLVVKAAPKHGVDWHLIVGAGLAKLTLPLGVNDSGALRVMATNDTGLRELMAKAEIVLANWNMASVCSDARRAMTLESWVRPGLAIPNVNRESTRVRKSHQRAEVPSALREEASRVTQGVENLEVRDALTDLRARALAARLRRKEQGNE